jgi:hypothetical protein
MDLEHLTKHQIVLLTLLVSFVTSIATGIVTVSLMSQAPLSVTRTINQIVERTVETVVPQSQNAAVVQKTLVVKDDDLAAQSIAAAQKSVVRITLQGSDQLLARGVIVDASGKALTDKAALAATGAEKFDVILADGTRVAALLQPTVATSSMAVVAVAVGTSTAWAPAAVADPSKLRLGQSVIRIGGKGVDAVGTGVIAMLPNGGAEGRVEASVQSSTPGSLLLTLFGEVIGITTSTSILESPGAYTLVRTN